jgi:hypothetical protein
MPKNSKHAGYPYNMDKYESKHENSEAQLGLLGRNSESESEGSLEIIELPKHRRWSLILAILWFLGCLLLFLTTFSYAHIRPCPLDSQIVYCMIGFISKHAHPSDHLY